MLPAHSPLQILTLDNVEIIGACFIYKRHLVSTESRILHGGVIVSFAHFTPVTGVRGP
jgi:hypothetical protein